MPNQIEKWSTQDGKEFESELDALKHEIVLLNRELKRYKDWDIVIAEIDKVERKRLGAWQIPWTGDEPTLG